MPKQAFWPAFSFTNCSPRFSSQNYLGNKLNAVNMTFLVHVRVTLTCRKHTQTRSQMTQATLYHQLKMVLNYFNDHTFKRQPPAGQCELAAGFAGPFTRLQSLSSRHTHITHHTSHIAIIDISSLIIYGRAFGGQNTNRHPHDDRPINRLIISLTIKWKLNTNLNVCRAIHFYFFLFV